MSAGFLGALAGVGPGMQSRRESDEKIAASKSERTIAEAQEDRKAEEHSWLKQFSEFFKQRGYVDDPAAWDQWRRFQQGQGPVAQTAPAAPAPTPVQQALPGVGNVIQPIQPVQPPPQQALPGMAAGGPVQVPPQQAQQPAALPTQPAPAPAPAENVPSRRERYNQWYNETAKYAALTGGLEGYQKFQEMENATSRRQVLGYALQAVRAMDEGNVGEAMRAGNSALEVTPFDTGLKFEASNGKLYMVGKDGKPGEPLTADHLRAFTEDHMKTPESYLQWKQQYETERSNLETERLRGGELDVSERLAGVQERRMNLDEQLAPRDTAARETQALAALRNSDARLAAAIDKSGSYGWDANNVLRITDNVLQWSLNDFEAFNDDANDFYKDNPQEFADLKSGVAQIMLANPWDEKAQRGAVDPDLAATVYQLVTLPGAVNLGLKEGDFQVGTTPEAPGIYFANYKGQRVALPDMLVRDAKRLAGQAAPPQAAAEEPADEEPAALPAAEAAALEGNAGGVIGSDPYGNPIVNESKVGSRKSRRG